MVSPFPVLFGLAVALRRREDAHKRLMLLASISLLPAAVGRIFRWPALGDIEAPATGASMLALLVAIAVCDVRARNGLHPAIGWGAPLLVLWSGGGPLIAVAVISP